MLEHIQGAERTNIKPKTRRYNKLVNCKVKQFGLTNMSFFNFSVEVKQDLTAIFIRVFANDGR